MREWNEQCVALAEGKHMKIIEMRNGFPGLQHTDHAIGFFVEIDALSDAIFAAKDSIINVAGQHNDRRTVSILLGRPGASVLKRYVEHAEELGKGCTRELVCGVLRRDRRSQCEIA